MLVGLRSRKHIASFELVRPSNIPEALAAGAEDGSAYLAGGIDLIDRLKTGVAVRRVVALAGLDGLKEIRREPEALVLGALATHDAIANHPDVAAAVPDLPALWRQVANPRIRFVGTLGGNLASGYAPYDGWPMVLAIGGRVVIAGPDGAPRVVDAKAPSDPDGALFLGIRVPTGTEPPRLLADRSLHPTVSVYLGAETAGGALRSLRVAVGCAFPQARVAALPVAGLAVAELGPAAAELAEGAAAELGEPVSDGLASGAYRRRMIAVLTRRLLVRLGASR